MKRRAMLAGAGMMVTGSGIISTSAAFGSATSVTSDLRVITEENLEVRAGNAFENPADSNKFVAYEESPESMFFDNSGGLNKISADEVPVATVNDGVNSDLIIETAISLDDGGVRFEEILEVENIGTTDKFVGISYDRQDESGQGAGQYGEDVVVGGEHANELTDVDVQRVYQFEAMPDGATSFVQISPDEENVGDDSPRSEVLVEAGTKKSIDLEIDFSPFIYGDAFEENTDPGEQIFEAAELDDPFAGSLDTVNLLDGITFGANDA